MAFTCVLELEDDYWIGPGGHRFRYGCGGGPYPPDSGRGLFARVWSGKTKGRWVLIQFPPAPRKEKRNEKDLR